MTISLSKMLSGWLLAVSSSVSLAAAPAGAAITVAGAVVITVAENGFVKGCFAKGSLAETCLDESCLDESCLDESCLNEASAQEYIAGEGGTGGGDSSANSARRSSCRVPPKRSPRYRPAWSISKSIGTPSARTCEGGGGGGGGGGVLAANDTHSADVLGQGVSARNVICAARRGAAG